MMKIKLKTSPITLPAIIIYFLMGSAPSQAQNLLEIYELAIQNSPILKQAQEKQLAIGELNDQSIARFLPVLSASAISNAQSQNNKRSTYQSLGYQEFWNNSFTFNLSQPLFHFDHWIKLSQSENIIAQAEANYLNELQNLIVKTTENYFNVLYAQDSLAFALEEKNAIARQLEQAQERFNAGTIAITDVNEAQSGFAQATASEIDANNNLENQKEALREIIGDSELNLNKLGELLPLLNPNPKDISAWSDLAELNNLNIISALNQAEAARKSVNLQHSGHLPTLDLVGNYAITDNSASFGFRGDTQSLGLKLDIPLFEGGAVNSRTRQAEHDYLAAKEDLMTKKRAAKRQVRDAYNGVMSSISRVEALKTAVTYANSALEASEGGFQAGIRTMVDVLLAQRDLYRAKRDLSRTRYDYLINSVKLKQAASSLNQDDIEQINRLLVSQNGGKQLGQ